MKTPKIANVRVITCRPTTENLVIVRVDTDDGSFGLGDATFTQRYSAVVRVVEDFLRPLLIGRDATETAELWRLMHHNGYWRGGPILNNAISGVDMALWDLKGKLADLPVYQLIGGQCRPAARIYRHTSGPDVDQLTRRINEMTSVGVQCVRVQVTPKEDPSAPGILAAASAGYGGSGFTGVRPDGSHEGVYLDADAYIREIDQILGDLRDTFGSELDLVHDVHSRLMPRDAVRLAERLERHGLFFLEDALPPEQLHWLPELRRSTTLPLAIGELFTSPSQWVGPVERHELDFIRMHVSAIGGFTPAWQAAQHAAMHDVRTAWHNPKDIAPIGVACNLHLDLASPNFGIQEFADWTEAEREIFAGLPEVRDGYLYPTDAPGWGITLDQAAAANYPASPDLIEWTQTRAPDGSLTRP
jgi:mannonate dehydratase